MFERIFKPKNENKDEDYFVKSQNWSTDKYTQAIIWRNWFLLIATLSLFLLMLSLLLLLKLIPLKENVPFLVFIDHEKGEPVTLKPVVSLDLIENSNLKKYMIRKFITARERYDFQTLSDDAQVVSLLGNHEVVKDYKQYLSKNNSLALFNLYANSTIDIGEIDIVFLNENRAYISFILNINQEGIFQPVSATADMKFHFAQRELPANEAQLINPVNFEVLSYQSHYQAKRKETL